CALDANKQKDAPNAGPVYPAPLFFDPRIGPLPEQISVHAVVIWNRQQIVRVGVRWGQKGQMN
ncbi:MAG: hypothetical protein EBX57_10640, partial [Betaproteobacteria bacterium]|nr:hypothetical protein [Betaproteobacteria bacterium]